MIGNLSFEEHVRHFNDMYNYLKSKYQHLDDVTAVETIRSKVMIIQEWENITYNLNIKNIHDTRMTKDFEIWVDRLIDEDLQDEDLQDEEYQGLLNYLRNDEEDDEDDDEEEDEEEDDEEEENDDDDEEEGENDEDDEEENDEDENEENDEDENEEEEEDENEEEEEEDLHDMRSQTTKELDEEDDIVDSEDEYLNEEGLTPEERLRRQRVAKQFRRLPQLFSSSSTHVNDDYANLPPSSSPPEIPDDY